MLLEKFINSNISLFIVEDDLNSTYNNIKEFSSLYTIIENALQEEFKSVFDDTSAEFISKTFLENTLSDSLKTGTGVFFDNLKSVFFNAALSKKIGLTSMGITLTNLFSGFGLSNLVLANRFVGMTPTQFGQLSTTAGSATGAIFSIGSVLLLYIGATIYKMIGTNAIVLIKNFEDCVKELMIDLKRFNPNLNNLNEHSNKLYDRICDERCGKIQDKKELLLCGSKNYMTLCSNYVLPEIFRGYFIYLKNKNYDIGYINSAADLFFYKNNKDRISHYAEKMFNKYHEIFDVILKDEKSFKTKCIVDLNNKCVDIFKQERSNAK